MRYQDIRQTLFKKVHGFDQPYVDSPATPRRLSPFRGKDKKHLRVGIDPDDLLQPDINRAARRAMKFPRIRTRDVALTPDLMPWRAAE